MIEQKSTHFLPNAIRRYKALVAIRRPPAKNVLIPGHDRNGIAAKLEIKDKKSIKSKLKKNFGFEFFLFTKNESSELKIA